jgi:GNAT superfamily N-acetyltransferase
MPPIRLDRVDPFDDRMVAEAMALEEAARVVDTPYRPPASLRVGRTLRRYGWDGEPAEEWLCRDDDGDPIGKLDIHLPERDNRHAALAGVLVRPDHRRRGLAEQLFARLLELVRRPGRRVLIGRSRDEPAGRAFAEKLGFIQVSVDVSRRQDLSALDWGRIGELRDRARAAASGYSLLRVTGPVPDHLIDEVAVMEAAINDAPRDALDIEDQVSTPARIRAHERSVAEAGLRKYGLIARRDADGRLAGHTVVFIDPEQPRYGWQGDTSVLAAHRGHRLGMLLKSEMMYWLAESEPGLRWIDTGNAESNRHMIAINEALGYQVLCRHLGWQRELG